MVERQALEARVITGVYTREIREPDEVWMSQE